ncbi:MAG: type I secretion protein TolC [Betaproteobacteria bacterium]|nr:MAG: type I secretion protein TolC [Betaproteobacteria bacterium]
MKTLSVSILGAVLALAFSASSNAETLKEIVTFAVETHPQVLSAVHKKDAADSATDAAFGGYLPRIDLIIGGGREWSQNPTTLGLNPPPNNPTNPHWVKLPRYQETVILNQMLWDGLGTRSEVARRQAISDASAHRLYGTSEEIALQTIEAYLDVLKNVEFVRYAKDNLAAHQKTYDQVKLRADRGVGRRADLEQIEARLALAISNVSSAESTLRDAEIAYLKVVGKAPASLTRPEAPQIPPSADEAVKLGQQNHPILKSAFSDIESAQAQRGIAKSFYSPRLEFEASLSNNRDLDGVSGPNRDRMVMMYLKWNLYRGGFDTNRTKETAKQINEAQEIARNTHRQVESAVRLAFNAYATARDRLPSLERYVRASDATRVAYAQQFNIGQRTLLDMLDAENEYFTSRTTQLNGQFIELGARYRVLNAMGALLNTMEVKPSEHSYVKSAAAPAGAK